MKHTIELTEDPESERTSWECGCGAAGSAPTYRAEEAAEKHVPEGVQVVYRHPAGGGW